MESEVATKTDKTNRLPDAPLIFRRDRLLASDGRLRNDQSGALKRYVAYGYRWYDSGYFDVQTCLHCNSGKTTSIYKCISPYMTIQTRML